MAEDEQSYNRKLLLVGFYNTRPCLRVFLFILGLTAVVICEGNLYDPNFKKKLNSLVSKLTFLLEGPQEQLKVDKVKFQLLFRHFYSPQKILKYTFF
jgi:hypothetical protein